MPDIDNANSTDVGVLSTKIPTSTQNSNAGNKKINISSLDMNTRRKQARNRQKQILDKHITA